MIVIDANLLIYSYNVATSFHPVARQWLGEAFSDEERVGIPFQSILAFIRVSTNMNLPGTRSTMAASLATVDSWLALANVRVLNPGSEHWRIFEELCLAAGATGDLATDAHIAALAIENDAMLCSVDRDFARFPGLQWRNPLET